MFRNFLSLMILASLVAVPSHAAAQSKSSPRNTGKSAVASTVNINSANAAEFEALPGIGTKTAALIVEYRQKNGPFKKVEELMNVRGIGEKNFLKLKGQLTVGASKADHDRQP